MILLGLLSACGSSPTWQDEVSFSRAWAHADSVTFDIPAQDTSQWFSLLLELAHTTDYPYQNIYMYVSRTRPSGFTVRERLHSNLTDNGGRWFGGCSGQNCNLIIPIAEQIKFDEVGVHRITLVQATRADPLPGIRGLSLELW